MKHIQKNIGLGLLSLSLISTVYGSVTLVKDGQPLADIVADTHSLSSVKLAAEDLQKHIKLISGATLTIVSAPSENFENHVYVGASEYTKKLGLSVDDLKAEGFKIVARDNYLALIGRDEQRQPFPYARSGEGLTNWQTFAGEKFSVPGVGPGTYNAHLGFSTMDATATLYATSEFLEQLGVRWYMPYENGTVIPEKKTIEVPNQNLTKTPAFPYRDFTFYGAMRADNEGVMWFKRLKYGASYLYYCNHTTWDIISQPEQRKEHPEYFAMANGKPISGMGARGVPRLTDLGFRKASVNYLNKTFEAYPPLVAMSVGMPDGFTEIDERDARIWSKQGKGFSDYVWDYWLFVAKELKKTHPDKYLACISYTTFENPPSQVTKLPENVTLHMAYATATLFLPSGRALEKIRSKWLDMLTSKRMYTFDHYLFYAPGRPRYPVFFTKLLQEDMQKLNGVCEGKFIEIAPEYPKGEPPRLLCPGLSHILHYWQGKLYWDPDMDREKMLNEYYDLYFGPAKAEMKEFYEFAEEVWMRPETRSITIVAGFLKQKDVDQYFDILRRAREKAGKDSVYDKRIAQIESEMQPLKSMFAELNRTGPDFSGSISGIPFKIDGDLKKPFWQADNTWYPMRDLVSGEAVSEQKSTQVAFRMTPDKSALIIGVNCREPAMDKIVVKGTRNDDFDIFNGDVIEVYLETPQRSFFKIAVNPDGIIWDESQDVTIISRDTTPTLWNPGTQVAIQKEKDGWNAEILIPTDDFGVKGPDKTNPWGINVCRARFAEDGIPCYALSPTGKKVFRVLDKLGNLVVE